MRPYARRVLLWAIAGAAAVLVGAAWTAHQGLLGTVRFDRLAGRLNVLLAERTWIAPQPARAETPGLRLVRTLTTGHGNAAGLVWGDDGRSLLLANEEGQMSAVKIGVAEPSRPRIEAIQATGNFLWAVDQRKGLLVFQPSLGDETLRLDPRTLAVVWKRQTGLAHAIATDGTRVYVPREGRPGILVVLSADGREAGRVEEADGWGPVYGATYSGDRGILGVAAGADRAKGITGGIYLYDTRRAAPALLGHIPRPASDIAIHAGRLWVASGSGLETWRIDDPAHPQQAGAWQQPVQRGPGGTPVRIVLGSMAANAAGTRVYAAYGYVTAQDGHGVSDWSAGVMVFDVSRDAPVSLFQQDWQAEESYHPAPTRVALSPDGGTLAVSYWRYGVRVFSVTGDRLEPKGGVATAGEAHDVFVDHEGLLYVFANETMQIIDPRTGTHVDDTALAKGGDGGWQGFRDGNIVVPGSSAAILRLADGRARRVQTLPGFGNYTWSVVFDGARYLYQGDEAGRIHVDEVSVAPDGKYRIGEVGVVQVPAVAGGANPLLAMALAGQTLWAVGPNTGLVGVDVSAPGSPRVVSHDGFTFQANGNHAGLVVARGRVYASGGSAGVIVYDPATRRRTGAIRGLNADFLDIEDGNFLVVANYWYPKLPEGAYVYDLRQNPDAPVLVDRFPKPAGSANFRVRAFGHRIYRVALYGIDILEGP